MRFLEARSFRRSARAIDPTRSRSTCSISCIRRVRIFDRKKTAKPTIEVRRARARAPDRTEQRPESRRGSAPAPAWSFPVAVPENPGYKGRPFLPTLFQGHNRSDLRSIPAGNGERRDCRSPDAISRSPRTTSSSRSSTSPSSRRSSSASAPRWRSSASSPDGDPVPYDGESGVLALMKELVATGGWKPEGETEGGPLIALLRDGASITLEPGSQLELSGAPLEHVPPDLRRVPRSPRRARAVLGAPRHQVARPRLPSVRAREQFTMVPKQRYCDHARVPAHARRPRARHDAPHRDGAGELRLPLRRRRDAQDARRAQARRRS